MEGNMKYKFIRRSSVLVFGFHRNLSWGQYFPDCRQGETISCLTFFRTFSHPPIIFTTLCSIKLPLQALPRAADDLLLRILRILRPFNLLRVYLRLHE